ncbi:hypothetical protein [Laspinema sp. D2d]|uniref:hypothetical protein n=1 Tax=Laspinema sp. D2d TaxID=2953686 RepID=UPI0021BACE6A|nr:hypothetical protein [Laspinema sp. D2d]
MIRSRRRRRSPVVLGTLVIRDRERFWDDAGTDGQPHLIAGAIALTCAIVLKSVLNMRLWFGLAQRW